MSDTELILQGLEKLRDEMRSDLKDLRSDFTAFSRDCGERLSSVETSVHSLEGNGQPGRVGVLETTVSSLSRRFTYAFGWAVGVLTLISTGVSLGVVLWVHYR